MHDSRTEAVRPLLEEERHLNGRADDALWTALGSLFRWRWFIVVLTTLVAIASVVLSLMLPNWYAASVRVLPPEASGSNPLTAALMRTTGSAASALLGGVSSDYARYLAILSSRRVLSAVVEEFDLAEVYELQDRPYPEQEALEILEENVAFPVDENYEFLSVVVKDTSPERAARMANFMVARLNEINTELSARNASNYRQFVERRYNEAQTALDSVLDATQSFQSRYGIMDLDVQTRAYFGQLADLRANATVAQVQYEALRTQLGDENEEVQALRSVAEMAEGKVQQALSGQGELMPVARGEMSDVARQYIELRREATVQQQVLTVIQPLIEQARFEEEKRVEAVQVVDEAIPPVRKAEPRRSMIVATATLSGFVVSVLFVLLFTWWKRRAGYVAHRLRASAAAPAPAES